MTKYAFALAALFVAGPAFAQSGATQSPPAPNSSSSAPSPATSVPAGGDDHGAFAVAERERQRRRWPVGHPAGHRTLWRDVADGADPRQVAPLRHGAGRGSRPAPHEASGSRRASPGLACDDGSHRSQCRCPDRLRTGRRGRHHHHGRQTAAQCARRGAAAATDRCGGPGPEMPGPSSYGQRPATPSGAPASISGRFGPASIHWPMTGRLKRCSTPSETARRR